ncbi:hypothetical protein JZ751_025206 [Albula glossodonta]|uniref:Uncharacterized protein n=1 Tax=Albula glossodonta TaxID=121402 RepID=A0A8T2NHK2_9TELE|nr:hypothetical protein JZ751_025206 [Albula glossodonta]
MMLAPPTGTLWYKHRDSEQGLSRSGPVGWLCESGYGPGLISDWLKGEEIFDGAACVTWRSWAALFNPEDRGAGGDPSGLCGGLSLGKAEKETRSLYCIICGCFLGF